jgi:hypothetical protein
MSIALSDFWGFAIIMACLSHCDPRSLLELRLQGTIAGDPGAAAERLDQRDAHQQPVLLDNDGGVLVRKPRVPRRDHSGIDHGSRQVFVDGDLSLTRN